MYYKEGQTEIVDVKGGPASRDFSLRRKLLEKAVRGEWKRKQ
ncbi:hypothetical protein [Domibacillus aminovorans]|nr:hypothetical protein [Domibacillus aminovorans]